MFIILPLLASLFIANQPTDTPIVRRVYIHSAINAKLIYLYVDMTVPQGIPLRNEALACLISELKATGLFFDVKAQVNPRDDHTGVDISITPTYVPDVEMIVVSKITLEDFDSVITPSLNTALAKQDIKPGALLFKLPVEYIREAIRSQIVALYASDDDQLSEVENNIFPLSYRIIVTGAKTAELTVMARGRMPCGLPPVDDAKKLR